MFSLEEYRAVRERAGLLDRSDRGRIELRGRDRASFLHGLLTNDIIGLEAGTGCYAAHLTPQGRMVADMRVLNVGDRLLLDVASESRDVLMTRFDQFIFTEDVQIKDISAESSCLAVHGPLSSAVVAAAVAPDSGPSQAVLTERLRTLAEFHSHVCDFHGQTLVAAANHDLGEPGFDLYLARSEITGLYDGLRAAGATEVGPDTVETLRIEAGRPVFHVDMDEQTIPLEAGLEDRAISQTKGCYIGQEVIVRILHRGHGRVARRLVGLVVETESVEDVPQPGDSIVSETEAVGHVTSATMSPALSRPIALGYVRRDLAEAGRSVHVLRAGSTVPAHLVMLSDQTAPVDPTGSRVTVGSMRWR